jgi:hypothetical protein
VGRFFEKKPNFSSTYKIHFNSAVPLEKPKKEVSEEKK